ncbi:DUF4143 domain-containing protein [Crocinitomicaceae bacterium]|nr:DUF4143 domain-containing protein [Crocinitomicaceae bacterium]
MIERGIHGAVSEAISKSKLVLIEGPKGAGKQTLIAQILSEKTQSFSLIDLSQKQVRKSLEETPEQLSDYADPILILRQAQFLPNLQSILEMTLTGELNATLIVTCSYPPMMDPELREALKIEGMLFSLYAPSFSEAAKHFGLTHEVELLEERLIFGNYPNVLSDLENASKHLSDMIDDVLHTQLGAKDRVNKGDKLMKMLKILAFQCGEPISYNDIAQRCGVDNETIERYIDLFEKAFLLIRLPSFHNGHRYELKKTHCIYFQDNGIRNALIQNFQEPEFRNDLDALWRNYMISERVKWIRTQGMNKELYFWRTHTRQQMDFIEKGAETLMAYKADPSMFSYATRKMVKIPKSFEESYPEAKTSVLNKSSYWNFLTRKV